MCDSGSKITAISGRKYRNILQPRGFELTPEGMRYITTVNGKRSTVSGCTTLPLAMSKEVWNVPLRVVEGLTNDIICGSNFLKDENLNLQTKTIMFRYLTLPMRAQQD